MKQLRGPKHENWPVCDPRAAPPGEYGLESGGNGHLARSNGAIDGPYYSLALPRVCLKSGVSRWLVGVVGLGVELHQRPQAARGALLPFEWLSKTRGAQAFARCARRLCAGWLNYAPCSREGQGAQRLCFSQPASLLNMCKKKTVVVHVTRW